MLHFRCLLLQSFLLCSVIFFQRCSAQDFKSVSPVLSQGYPGHQPDPRPRCRSDEEWKDCGSACPPNCDNYGKSTICTAQCVSGCFCKEGLVRNWDGRCIIPERCQKKSCNDDEELQTCGSSCPNTCDNYGTLRKCPGDCVKGCYCKRGLVRNSDFRCIIPEKCNKHVCNPDEVHKECGTACPATCDSIVSRFQQLVLCINICVKGCFCKDGTVRNLDTMRCVPPKECTPHPHGNCGKNAFYSKCASKCPPSCKKSNKACPDVCVEGCVCKKGLVFDDNGDCIPECHCPGKNGCGINEEPSDCVVPCNDCRTKGKCNFLVCNKGCDCKKGYYQNARGICIPQSQCPSTTHCGPNEEFDKCRYPCEPTCSDPKPHCIHECKKGCFCKDGFVRSETTGQCVRKEHCEKPRCRKNEYYDPCRKPCESTCKEPNPSCIPECKEGCYCKPGFIRLDWNRPCVPIKVCKKKQGTIFTK